MATVVRRTTPEELSAAMRDLANGLGKADSFNSLFLKDKLEEIRANILTGRDALGNPVPGLSPIYKDGQAKDEGVAIGKRSSYGITPLVVTQRLVNALRLRSVSGVTVIEVDDSDRSVVAAMQSEEVSITVSPNMQRRLASLGMKVRVGTVLRRPPRFILGITNEDIFGHVRRFTRFVMSRFFRR